MKVRTIVLIVLAVIVVGIFLSCSLLALLAGSVSDSPVKSGSLPATTSDTASAKPLTLKIGDTATYDGGLKVTVLSADKGPTDYEGKSTFKVEVNYVNAGTDTAAYSEGDWKLQDAAGARTNDSAYFMNPPAVLGAGDLAPGGKKTGTIYFSGNKFVAVVFEANIFDGESALSSWTVK